MAVLLIFGRMGSGLTGISYIYHPTAYDYNLISDAVEDYISMYADQSFGFGGMDMGGM